MERKEQSLWVRPLRQPVWSQIRLLIARSKSVESIYDRKSFKQVAQLESSSLAVARGWNISNKLQQPEPSKRERACRDEM